MTKTRRNVKRTIYENETVFGQYNDVEAGFCIRRIDDNWRYVAGNLFVVNDDFPGFRVFQWYFIQITIVG